ncbi:hypothetical protein GGR55DRAFT_251989 [Xylaria sp. FL0064]|nr:hypothetical protein GGR55DRAFT_251989 [Xylaria sp. FL0064]
MLQVKSKVMEMTFIQRLCKSLQTPALVKRYSDAAVGLVFIICSQLFVVPIQVALDLHSINIPASILVMLLVFFTMTIASSISGNVSDFYNRHLRGPTDFVGRHMSLGFVAFFVLLIRDHVSNSLDIPRLAGVFVLTTIVSYVISYVLAYGGFHLEHRLRRRRRAAVDIESNNKTWPSPSIAWPAPPCEHRSKIIDQLSPLSEALSTKEPLVKTSAVSDSSTTASIDFVLRTAPIWIWLFLLSTVGLPIYLATGYMMPLEVFSFTLFWVLSIQFQRCLRDSKVLARFRRMRTFVLIFCNPLLLTWALATAYMWTKASCAGKDISVVVVDFRHYSSLARCIMHLMQDPRVPAHLGAGDLAGILLDAGVACMGFKMYEYRSELWASLGTVSFTCAALAVVNVFVNVLIGHGIGLQAEDAIAFAGRSATLALGIPAIENLGGSATLASTIAIFSGIVFQMAGDWLFSVLHINDRVSRDGQARPLKVRTSPNKHASSCETTLVGSTEEKQNGRKDSRTATDDDEGTMVVAGVTVGINGAAMGTAWLIERDSRAVAYSALAMIVFGAVTVALTAIPAAAQAIRWLTTR